MVRNPSKDGQCMAMTTRSGKVLSDLVIVGTEQMKDTTSEIDEHARRHIYKKVEAKVDHPLPPLHKPPPLFPQRLKKKAEDGKFLKFISMLKEISVYIPLVESLEKGPGYTKFMKDLVTKKRTVSFETADNLHHCSAIVTMSLVEKKENQGAFTIPCTIGDFDFARSLCDLGAIINLMPLDIYKQLGLGGPKSTSM
ncbi:uncharacterized protein LOC129875672 [Solanum dulcamara]|uniref:uncharacterized protein LOC129875672 n=1 Tax=Solanum dulcamara TaxID=45834 RepID=UPI0024858362|nr:uncharacterized protein LOC129875672 [Solanum dulcamara]